MHNGQFWQIFVRKYCNFRRFFAENDHSAPKICRLGFYSRQGCNDADTVSALWGGVIIFISEEYLTNFATKLVKFLIQFFLSIERRLSSAKPLVLLRDGRTLGTEQKTFRLSPRRLGDEQKAFCLVPRVLPSSKMATIGKNLIPNKKY